MSAYERQREVAAESGATIVIYDTHHPRSVFDRAGGRWVTFCEAHEMGHRHATLELARAFANCPGDWCEPCYRVTMTRTRAAAKAHARLLPG